MNFRIYGRDGLAKCRATYREGPRFSLPVCVAQEQESRAAQWEAEKRAPVEVAAGIAEAAGRRRRRSEKPIHETSK